MKSVLSKNRLQCDQQRNRKYLNGNMNAFLDNAFHYHESQNHSVSSNTLSIPFYLCILDQRICRIEHCESKTNVYTMFDHHEHRFCPPDTERITRNKPNPPKKQVIIIYNSYMRNVEKRQKT